MTKHIATNPTTNRHWIGFADYDRNSAGAWQSHPWGIAPTAASATWQRGAETFAGALDLTGAPVGYDLRGLWSVRSEPDAQGKRGLAVLDGSRAVVAKHRDGAERAVAVVGSAYALIGEREVAQVLDALQLAPDAVAYLDDGRRWYMQSSPETDEVRDGPGGRLASTFFVEGSHDGSIRVRGGETSTIIVCANTHRKARVEALGSDLAGAIAHRAGASEALDRWHQALAAAKADRAKFLDLARFAAEAEASDDGVTAILAAAFPAETRAAVAARDRVSEILADANPATGVDGRSVFDVLQALTFYTSHEAKVRGAAPGTEDAARAFGDLAAPVDQAWSFVRTEVLA